MRKKSQCRGVVASGQALGCREHHQRCMSGPEDSLREQERYGTRVACGKHGSIGIRGRELRLFWAVAMSNANW